VYVNFTLRYHVLTKTLCFLQIPPRLRRTSSPSATDVLRMLAVVLAWSALLCCIWDWTTSARPPCSHATPSG